MATKVTPVQIGGTLSTGAWTDIDVTASVGGDAGSVAAVILQVFHVPAGSAGGSIQFRTNGSTDVNVTRNNLPNTHTIVYVGVDSSDIFEYYSSRTDIELYLVGYLTTAEAEFLTNRIDKSIGTTASWTNIDLSGDFTATAKVACGVVEQVDGGYTRSYGVREDGSTDDRRQDIGGNVQRGGFAIGCTSEIFEMYIAGTNVDMFIHGIIYDNVTTFANGKDYSTGTTGSYIDVDVSADVGAGNDGAIIEIYNATAYVLSHGFRLNGGSLDSYFDPLHHMIEGAWVALDANRIFEQKTEHATRNDLYLMGYTSTPSAAVVAYPQKSLRRHMRRIF